MEKKERKENRYGLLGKNIGYSFSQGYFTKKFKDLGLADHSYQNFDIETISKVEDILQQQGIKGLNVTIPYKQEIIPYLDRLDPIAQKIGAVNTIKIAPKGLIGYNTDAHGFKTALLPFLKAQHVKALVLGTGGASKAICFVLDELDIKHTYVSRSKKKNQLLYDELDESVMQTHTLIINCTPVGTYPNIEDRPPIPYQYVGEKHLLFDLIYNPEKTRFLTLGEQKGAAICNGKTMLVGQAEKAWEIWNTPD
ncbi:shikimate dehydrogenase [Muricauda sp. JGD-17]|uniref:Shikimate dehydrogenase n=1 Tax=Flagellimonas ochracea TaxID=2696472 RepID=A0A964T8Y7_9FLAO|nr:shikimate dehydrogenase [Allomuricauda ochracea]NAY90435.1 shikimate dehydrogenase [Allomuricauda ochracea]